MDADAQERAGAEGAIEAVAHALRAFPVNAAIQEAGCGALANIGWTRAELQARAREAGAVELCEAALRAFPSHAGVQKYARLAMGKLNAAPA